MAIQVSGTQVIGNSRELTNIASVDATTAASITAAGVGGTSGVQSFTAAQTITAGNVVGVNSDGTISIGSASLGAETTAYGAAPAGTYNNVQITYDTNADRYVLVYNNTSNDFQVVVGTLSSGTISWGSPVTVGLGGNANGTALVFDSNSNKIVIGTREGCFVGQVASTGNSITMGSKVSFPTALLKQDTLTGYFDSSQNKCVFIYAANGSTQGKAVVGTVSGNSISFGSESNLGFGSFEQKAIDSCFNTTAGKGVAFSGNGTNGQCIVLTVSGTSVSGGSAQTVSTGNSLYCKITSDHSSATIVTYYYLASTLPAMKARAATISGTTLSFGTETNVFSDGNYGDAAFVQWVSEDNVLFGDGAAVHSGTVSGTTLTYSETWDFASTIYYNAGAYDATTGSLGVAFRDGSSIKTKLVNPSAPKWIGFAAENISSGNAGDVTVVGGINTNQSGLTAGSNYTVSGDTLVVTTTASEIKARALSATKIYVTSALS